jgi:hypothetical protein
MRTPGSFLSGILFGMLAAIGIVFLIMNDFSPSRLFGSNENNSSIDTIVDLTNEFESKSRKSNKSNPSTTIPSNYQEGTFIDSSFIAPSTSDSLATTSNINEEIVVRRDELLKSIMIEASIIGKSNQSVKTDSLLNVFQGGQNANENIFRLEFWQSPVNFKGFKLIRNGIISFGLDPEDITKLFDLNGTLILRSGSFYYRLYPTDRFMPYQRISDENTIKQLRS